MPAASFEREHHPSTSLVFVLTLCVWIGVTTLVYIVSGRSAANAGPFGDMFGAVNALFTGLAFAGVICTLRLQLQQMAAAEAEATRLADAENETREAFNKAAYAASFKSASEILQAEGVRRARGVVIEGIGEVDFSRWTKEQRNAATTVCHTYNQVGIMVRYGLLPSHYIADSWGDSLRKCWARLEPFVRDLRSRRAAPEFWDDFEMLAVEALKYQRPSSEVETERVI